MSVCFCVHRVNHVFLYQWWSITILFLLLGCEVSVSNLCWSIAVVSVVVFVVAHFLVRHMLSWSSRYNVNSSGLSGSYSYRLSVLPSVLLCGLCLFVVSLGGGLGKIDLRSGGLQNLKF